MAYEIWGTCMLVPGFSRSECASWVQAWGSILAICAAIAIAWWQRREEHRKGNLTDLANATVVGSTLKINIEHIITCIDSMKSEWVPGSGSPPNSHDLNRYLLWLKKLTLPTEDQVLKIAAVSPGSAILIASATVLVRQTQSNLDIVSLHSIVDVSRAIHEISGPLKKARENFATVLPLFTKFLHDDLDIAIKKSGAKYGV